jgi:hypothetical protein
MTVALRECSALAALILLTYLACRVFPDQAAALRAQVLPAPRAVPTELYCRPCPRVQPPSLPLLPEREA